MPTQGATSAEQARANLALWLRQGRARRNMTVDDVCRITKIQPRIVESLESGRFDRLPATVFVRGFVRSIARCVGLDADEALVRLGAVMAGGLANDRAVATPVARALVETMSELAPVAAEAALAAGSSSSQPFEFVDLSELEPEIEIVYSESEHERSAPVEVPLEISVEASVGTDAMPAAVEGTVDATAKKKRTRKPRGTDAPTLGDIAPKKRVRKTAVKADGAAEPVKPRRRRKAVGTPLEPTPVVVEAASVVETAPVVVEAAPVVEIAPVVETAPVVESAPPAVDFWAPRDVEPADELATPPSAAEPPWQPTMPPPAATPPWRRSFSIPVPSSSSPVLVIDDADPDRAEREQEARSPRRSSFLPSILLDRDDRSARQGGLTLAVIILLIAATLTLSYLMRRPSASGDGVTMDETTLDTPAQLA